MCLLISTSCSVQWDSHPGKCVFLMYRQSLPYLELCRLVAIASDTSSLAHLSCSIPRTCDTWFRHLHYDITGVLSPVTPVWWLCDVMTSSVWWLWHCQPDGLPLWSVWADNQDTSVVNLNNDGEFGYSYHPAATVKLQDSGGIKLFYSALKPLAVWIREQQT